MLAKHLSPQASCAPVRDATVRRSNIKREDELSAGTVERRPRRHGREAWEREAVRLTGILLIFVCTAPKSGSWQVTVGTAFWGRYQMAALFGGNVADAFVAIIQHIAKYPQHSTITS
jgi:hypothetical protein